MAGCVSLNGEWQLTWAEGSPLTTAHPWVQPQQTCGRGYLSALVPAPIHQVLMEAGLLDDPNVGMNSLRARWVEEQFWVYRRTFDVPAAAVAERSWLSFERLEYEAVVYLNGQVAGRHANAHRPARFDVTGKLRAGENLLVVQLTAGFHGVSDRPGTDYDRSEIGRLVKRHWTRKPQYQSGWDWNARLVNVGILGDVRLEWHPSVLLDQVSVCAQPSPSLECADVRVRFSVLNPCDSPVSVQLHAAVADGEEQRAVVEALPGLSTHDLHLCLREPRLWWPLGHGEPFLYTVQGRLTAEGDEQRVVRRTGVRLVEIDQSPHVAGGSHFILRVNGRPIFCKGGNWVPADMLYSRVTRDRHRALAELAVSANFNTLRIWGGGLFADAALCDACDELGLLIWHDFLFACAKYPGDDPEFAAEVRREVTHAVREMAHHPSLVVWCGNNEVEWGDWGWGYDTWGRTHPHYALFHHDFPLIVRHENPSVPYWPSSPYSPGQLTPNEPTVGDQHPWTVSLGPAGPDWWQYRTYVDRFPNEGGVLGASSPATLRQFLPENERQLLSPSWEHHDNPFACMPKAAGELGRSYETVRFWTGRDPMAMDWETYAFLSGLLQAEGLQEYIANYRRRMFSSASAIFWMYNDSWPVTHGWTIVDYYLRRKLAYHPVRRAFRPVTCVVAEDGDLVTVFGVNETTSAWQGQLRSGLFLLDGGLVRDEWLDVTLPPNKSVPLTHIRRSEWESHDLTRSGAFAILSQSGKSVAQHRLFLRRFGELAFAKPTVRLTLDRDVLTLEADVFAWGVCLDVDGERPLTDDCLDLLPGIPQCIKWDPACGEPKVLRCGSDELCR